MKHVNRNNRGKSGKIRDSSTARVGKSGKRRKPKKVPCLTADVQKPATNNEDLLPEIPGVEQLDIPMPGSKCIVGEFYKDESALLLKRATCVVDRRTVFISPRIGWPKGLYRKPETK